MAETIRVLIADDHRLFRHGIRALTASVTGLEVVAEAADGVHAAELAARLRPDLVLMDLHMPGGSGLDAIRRIAAGAPEAKVLVLTMFDDDESVFAALRAGARGYVLKDAEEDELIRAMFTVARGGALYGAGVARRIAAQLAAAEGPSAPTDAAAPADAAPFPHLTPSERRVLEQLARGLNNDAIATVLGYSPKTIRNYVSIIFAKLHVADRAQAIVAAREAGIGTQRER